MVSTETPHRRVSLQRKKPLTRKTALRSTRQLGGKRIRRAVETSDREGEAARKLWPLLATRPGPPFHPCERLGPYVADFFCPTARLVILIQGEEDPRRQEWFAGQGYHVLSFGADAVCSNPDDVLATVAEAFKPRVIKS